MEEEKQNNKKKKKKKKKETKMIPVKQQLIVRHALAHPIRDSALQSEHTGAVRQHWFCGYFANHGVLT